LVEHELTGFGKGSRISRAEQHGICDGICDESVEMA